MITDTLALEQYEGVEVGTPMKPIQAQKEPKAMTDALFSLEETSSVREAALYMCAKRTNVLLVTRDGCLTGLLTDKELAYSLASGSSIDDRIGLIAREPVFAEESITPFDAVYQMVHDGCDSLPIVNSEQEVLGVCSMVPMAAAAFALDVNENAQVSSFVGFEPTSIMTMRGCNDESFQMQSLPEGTGVCSGIVFPTVDCLFGEDYRLPSVLPSESVTSAVALMKELGQTAVVVVQENYLEGILTTHNVVYRVLAGGLDPSTTPVSCVMTPSPDCIAPETTLDEALAIMQEAEFRHLPVIVDSTAIGLVDSMAICSSILQILYTPNDNSEDHIWDRFWNSDHNLVDMDLFEDLVIQEDDHHSFDDGIVPEDSASRISRARDESDCNIIMFKVYDFATQMSHRLQAGSMQDIVDVLEENGLCADGLTFVNESGDYLPMRSQEDYEAAVSLARAAETTVVRLALGQIPKASTDTGNKKQVAVRPNGGYLVPFVWTTSTFLVGIGIASAFFMRQRSADAAFEYLVRTYFHGELLIRNELIPRASELLKRAVQFVRSEMAFELFSRKE